MSTLINDTQFNLLSGIMVTNQITGINGSGDYMSKFTSGGGGLVNSNIKQSGNIVEVMNDLNPQDLYLYKYIDSTGCFERGYVKWTSNTFDIGCNFNGTGIKRQTRVMGGNGGAAITTADTDVAIGSALSITANTVLYAPSNGLLRLTNSTSTDFNRLAFGGTSSSFPAIKKSGVNFHFILADESSFTNIQVANAHLNNFLISSGLVISGNYPTSRTSPGISGQMAIKSGFLYVCTGSSLWGRVALSPF